MTSLLLALHAQAHYQVHQDAGFHVSPWVPCTISCMPSLDLDQDTKGQSQCKVSWYLVPLVSETV
jgi:hypothetical protein